MFSFVTVEIIQETNIFDQQLEDIQRTIADLHQSNIQPILELLHQSQTIYCFATGFIQKIALDEFYTRMLSLNKRALVLPNKTEQTRCHGFDYLLVSRSLIAVFISVKQIVKIIFVGTRNKNIFFSF